VNVLITGSNGFIAKNLKLRLKGTELVDNILLYDRSTSQAELSEMITDSDFVFHLAGVNRPKDEKDFDLDNVGLTKLICELIESNDKEIGLAYSSSTQAEISNPYGESKLKAEDLLGKLSKNTKVKVANYRLPGIFGKWSKPNYNSVVSTFCNSIANDKEIVINDPLSALSLVYIDDVVESMLECITLHWTGYIERMVTPVYVTTVGGLADKIKGFHEGRRKLFVDTVGVGFERALYATYLSYLPKNTFKYPLDVKGDERGDFVEILKTQDSGQFSFFTCKPKITRGNHFHHTKNEKFIVVKGKAEFNFKNLDSGEVETLTVSGENPEVVDTIPGWIHDITNVGEEDMIVVIWANEIFDQHKPDTYSN